MHFFVYFSKKLTDFFLINPFYNGKEFNLLRIELMLKKIKIRKESCDIKNECRYC